MLARRIALVLCLLVACAPTPDLTAPDDSVSTQAQSLSAEDLAFFRYPIAQRNVIQYGGEAYPPLHRGNYAFNPSITRTARGDLLASYCRGSTHGSTDMKAVVLRSGDEGRSWGNVVLDEVLVYDPATIYGSGVGAYCASGLLRLHSGRLVYAIGDIWVPTSPSRRPRVAISDDDGYTWTVSGTLPPGGISQTAFGGRPFQIGTDIFIPAYSRDATSSSDPARIFLYVSHDDAATWSLGPVIFDGVAQPMGSPLRRNWQEEECDRIVDSPPVTPQRRMCLIRSYDTNAVNVISRSYSLDGGLTWSTPVDVFPGAALPRWGQLDSGMIVVATRQEGVGFADSQSVYRTSADRGATWSSEIILSDYEADASEYVGLYSNGTFFSGINAQQLIQAPSATRLTYFEIDEQMLSTADVAGSALWAWYDMSSITATYPNYALGDHVSTWPDSTGHGHDLVVTPGRPAWIYRPGETYANGYVGQPVLEQITGSGWQLQTPTSLTQPYTVIMMLHSWMNTQGGSFQLLDDTSNMFLARSSATQIQLWVRGGGPVVTYNAAGWTAQPSMVTAAFNGANTSLYINGSLLTPVSGGPIGSYPVSQLLFNGHGSDGFASDYREAAVLTATSAAFVQRMNRFMHLKHRLP